MPTTATTPLKGLRKPSRKPGEAQLNGWPATLTRSQTREVLAAGLGHKSYASFRAQDEAQLNSAQFVVFSAAAMAERADMIRQVLLTYKCHLAVQWLESRREIGQRVAMDDGFFVPVMSALEEVGHPNKAAIAANLGCDVFDVLAGRGPSPINALDETDGDWRWQATGTLRLQSATMDWHVPIRAEISFPRLGRRLFGKPDCLKFEQAGPPVEAEFEYLDLESPISDSLS